MNRIKKNLFLPIEFKHREFLSKLLLASFALKAGFRVYVGSSNSIFRLIKSKRKKEGIFFFKGGLELELLVNLKKKCDHFVILDEELGTVKNDYAKIARDRIWPDTEKYIDRYYVIGKYGYEASYNIFPKMKNKIKCTGWPRVDLWRKENDHLFKKETELINKKYGDFVLFSSDFGYNSLKIMNQRLNDCKNSSWTTRKQYYIEKELAEKTFKDFNYFKKLLKDYDGIKGSPLIIIRPHPTDDLDTWINFSKELSNIKIVYEGEITPWINASSGVVHRGCAAAIQAHMRGLPVGHFVSENAKIYETPYKISKHIYSLKELIEFCKTSIRDNNVNIIKYHDEFKKMIYVKKDELASELIVRDLLKLETNTEFSFQTSFKNTFVDMYIYIRAIIKKFLIFFSIIEENLGTLSYSKKIPGGITENEVKNFLYLLDSNQNSTVKKIFKDCIEID